ncbi:MAG: UDP-N-acetylglucosamine pyrophosphorylase [Clostridia bacterium]|nr:UDP-N-acetylglucosamine pyrophosphorylase [Clostridia bacterium]
MNNSHFCLFSNNLFDMSHTIAAPLLQNATYPWEALPHVADFIRKIGASLDPALYTNMGGDVYIAKDAKIAPSAYIDGPCIIGSGAEIRHCAFIRGSVIVGAGAVVGNSTELKNCILFDSVQVPHYNYVGDSILGYKAHLGAGAVTSNVKSDKSHVHVKGEDFDVDTGRKKVGAMLGDGVEIGCGAVLCPGTLIGRGSTVYPLVRVRGVIPENHIVKDAGLIVPRR